MSVKILSALRRKLTGAYRQFLNHPNRDTLVIGVCGSAIGGVGLLANQGFNVSPSVSIAYVVALGAVGFSGYAWYRINDALRRISQASPVEVIDSCREDGAALLQEKSGSKLDSDSDKEISRDIGIAGEKIPASVCTPLDVLLSGQTHFAASPVFTLPHRRLAMVRGEITFEEQRPSNNVEADQLRLAHAVAYASRSKGAHGKPVIIEMSIDGLDNEDYIEDLLELVASVPAVAKRLIFELPEVVLTCLNQSRTDLLAQLKQHGLQFAACKTSAFVLTDFVLHKPRWHAFSYIEMPADIILSTDPEIIRLLEALKIQIIASQVSKEADLIELMDLNVLLAAGPLFVPAVLPQTDEKPAHLPIKRGAGKPAGPKTNKKTKADKPKRSASKKAKAATTANAPVIKATTQPQPVSPSSTTTVTGTRILNRNSPAAARARRIRDGTRPHRLTRVAKLKQSLDQKANN